MRVRRLRAALACSVAACSVVVGGTQACSNSSFTSAADAGDGDAAVSDASTDSPADLDAPADEAGPARGVDAAAGCAALGRDGSLCEDFDRGSFVDGRIALGTTGTTFIDPTRSVSAPASLAIAIAPDGGKYFGARVTGPAQKVITIDFDFRVDAYSQYFELFKAGWQLSSGGYYWTYLTIYVSKLAQLSLHVNDEGDDAGIVQLPVAAPVDLFDMKFHHLHAVLDRTKGKADVSIDGLSVPELDLPAPSGAEQGTMEVDAVAYGRSLPGASWDVAMDNLVIEPW